jgi:DNA modification methylase
LRDVYAEHIQMDELFALLSAVKEGEISEAQAIKRLSRSEDYPLFGPRQDARSFVVGLEPKPEHPSPKPLNVMRWILGCLPGETVLDPFMGSGTTLRAAKDLGRRAIGIEIEERYCEIAAKRLAQEVFDFG